MLSFSYSLLCGSFFFDPVNIVALLARLIADTVGLTNGSDFCLFALTMNSPLFVLNRCTGLYMGQKSGTRQETCKLHFFHFRRSWRRAPVQWNAY